LVWNLEALITDVKTEFLHGNLQEEIYMDIPLDMDENKDQCLQLEKIFNGLIQSSRELYKRLIGVLKLIGFTGSKAYLCLWIKWDDNGVTLIGINF
jgi:hypothetical protein